MDSLFSSKPTGPWMALLLVFGGCVTVAPTEREHLAEPGMEFTSGDAQGHEEHVFGNREGSVGGGAVSAGGCACN